MEGQYTNVLSDRPHKVLCIYFYQPHVLVIVHAFSIIVTFYLMKHVTTEDLCDQIIKLFLRACGTLGYAPYELYHGVAPEDKIRNILHVPPNIDKDPQVRIEIARKRIANACKKTRARQKKCSTIQIREKDLVMLMIPHQSDEDRKVAKSIHKYHELYVDALLIRTMSFSKRMISQVSTLPSIIIIIGLLLFSRCRA